MILQVMFFDGLVGKLWKLLHLYIYRKLYKEKAGRECVCERARALRESCSHLPLVLYAEVYPNPLAYILAGNMV